MPGERNSQGETTQVSLLAAQDIEAANRLREQQSSDYEKELRKRIGGKAMELRAQVLAATANQAKDISYQDLKLTASLFSKGLLIQYDDIGDAFTQEDYGKFLVTLAEVRLSELLGFSLKKAHQATLLPCKPYDTVYVAKNGAKIFLGSAPAYDSVLPQELKPKHKEHRPLIVSCIRDKEAARESFIKAHDWNFKGVDVIRNPVEDFSSKGLTTQRLLELSSAMKATIDAGESVYVHCKAGRSRSASVVIAYLMRYEGLSLIEAHDYITDRRPVAVLSASQWKIMLDFERDCLLAKTQQYEAELKSREALALTQARITKRPPAWDPINGQHSTVIASAKTARKIAIIASQHNNPLLMRPMTKAVASMTTQVIAARTALNKNPGQALDEETSKTLDKTHQKCEALYRSLPAEQQSAAEAQLERELQELNANQATEQTANQTASRRPTDVFTPEQQQLIKDFYKVMKGYLDRCKRTFFSRHGSKGWKRAKRIMNAFAKLANDPEEFPKTKIALKGKINKMLTDEGLGKVDKVVCNKSCNFFHRHIFEREENKNSLRRTLRRFVLSEEEIKQQKKAYKAETEARVRAETAEIFDIGISASPSPYTAA